MNRSSSRRRDDREAAGFKRLRALARCELGQDVAEMAMVLPFLLVLVLGVVEFGRLFAAQHSLTSIGREGANIAARGASLDEVTALMMENGSDLDLAAHGGAISSHVVVVDSGVVRIVEQSASSGFGGLSRLGDANKRAPSLDRLSDDEGAQYFVVELFYVPQSITPLRRLLSSAVPDTLYARSVF